MLQPRTSERGAAVGRGRDAGYLAERADEVLVGSESTAGGDFVEADFRLEKQPACGVDPNANDFVVRRTSERAAKVPLEPAPRDRNMLEYIRHAAGLAGMFADIANCLGDIRIVHRQHICALSLHDAQGRKKNMTIVLADGTIGDDEPSGMGDSLPGPLMIGPEPTMSGLPHHRGVDRHAQADHDGDRQGLHALSQESLLNPERGQSTLAS